MTQACLLICTFWMNDGMRDLLCIDVHPNISNHMRGFSPQPPPWSFGLVETNNMQGPGIQFYVAHKFEPWAFCMHIPCVPAHRSKDHLHRAPNDPTEQSRSWIRFAHRHHLSAPIPHQSWGRTVSTLSL